MLKIILGTVKERTLFETASAKEIAKENRDFISKLIRLDPRDRPSAKVPIQDVWFTEGEMDSMQESYQSASQKGQMYLPATGETAVA